MAGTQSIREPLVRIAVTAVLDPGHVNEDGTISILLAAGEACCELVLQRRDADDLAVDVLGAEDPTL